MQGKKNQEQDKSMKKKATKEKQSEEKHRK